MRIRMTDGTREVEVEAEVKGPEYFAALRDTARQLYAELTPRPERGRAPIGFGPSLDGTTLSSDTERAEPYDDGHDDYDKDEGDST